MKIKKQQLIDKLLEYSYEERHAEKIATKLLALFDELNSNEVNYFWLDINNIFEMINHLIVKEKMQHLE